MRANILVVDDEAGPRESLRMILNVDHEVRLAASGREALEMIQELPPDLVFLDIRMPKGNGIATLEVLKANEGCPAVIMLTAFPYPQYREKCLRAGADYFFDKATEFDSVHEALEQLRARLVIADR